MPELWGGWGDLIVVLRCAMLVMSVLLGWLAVVVRWTLVQRCRGGLWLGGVEDVLGRG